MVSATLNLGINTAYQFRFEIMGLILFLVMINDQKLKSLHTSHWKYVDDLSISEFLSIHDQPTQQSNLEEIQQWAKERNDMRLNVKNCKEMVIRFLRQSPNVSPCISTGIHSMSYHHLKYLVLLSTTI